MRLLCCASVVLLQVLFLSGIRGLEIVPEPSEVEYSDGTQNIDSVTNKEENTPFPQGLTRAIDTSVIESGTDAAKFLFNKNKRPTTTGEKRIFY